jgi:hypothetical protein
MAHLLQDEWPTGAGFQYHPRVLSPRTDAPEVPPASPVAEGSDTERGVEVTG